MNKLKRVLSAITPKSVNWPIIFVFFIYAVVKDNYFGWNLTPQTSFEVIADGIGVLIFALALISNPITVNIYGEE